MERISLAGQASGMARGQPGPYSWQRRITNGTILVLVGSSVIVNQMYARCTAVQRLSAFFETLICYYSIVNSITMQPGVLL